MCEEDGIFCELNQESCITYNIPLFSTLEDLQPLRDSLIKRLKEINDRGKTLAENDSPSGEEFSSSFHQSHNRTVIHTQLAQNSDYETYSVEGWPTLEKVLSAETVSQII